QQALRGDHPFAVSAGSPAFEHPADGQFSERRDNESAGRPDGKRCRSALCAGSDRPERSRSRQGPRVCRRQRFRQHTALCHDRPISNAGKTSPTFTSVRVESRSPAGQDGPPVRPAIHPDGTVYAVFHSWLTFDSNDEGTADIVVVRDDNVGNGPSKFKALVDSGDSKAGIRVVKKVKFNFA